MLKEEGPKKKGNYKRSLIMERNDVLARRVNNLRRTEKEDELGFNKKVVISVKVT